MVGVAASPENGQPMLAVANVNEGNSSAVIGVAKEAVSHEIVALEDGNEYVTLRPLPALSLPIATSSSSLTDWRPQSTWLG